MMLFSKQKSDIDELPPPPPPFPKLNFEDAMQDDSSSNTADMPQAEFSDLVRSLESEAESAKAEKIEAVPKAKKLAIRGQKNQKILEAQPSRKEKARLKAKEKAGNIEIDGIDLESPSSGTDGSDFAAFDVNDYLNAGKASIRQKPKEVLEAQDEIKSAIERIKIRERPSLLKRIFPGKPAEARKDENLFPLVKETGDLDIVRNKISMAKRAIMNLKLDEARKEYDEMIRVYNSMKPKEQAEVYEGIKEIYLERKNAESLKLAA